LLKFPENILSRSPVERINPMTIGIPIRKRGNPKVGERSKIVTKLGVIRANIIAVADTIQPFQFLGFNKDLKSF
tara:strand:- start:59 stop:280 length:222 start_codon:yes stop_codon:yes gene_type:complete